MQAGADDLDNGERPIAVQSPPRGSVEGQGLDVGVEDLFEGVGVGCKGMWTWAILPGLISSVRSESDAFFVLACLLALASARWRRMRGTMGWWCWRERRTSSEVEACLLLPIFLGGGLCNIYIHIQVC